MNKPIAYALMLAATLTMAACNKTPEDKLDSAKEHAQDAQESSQKAAQETSEAIEQKTDEAHDNAAK
jgi:cytochrome c5